MKSWSVRETLGFLKNDMGYLSFSPPDIEHLTKEPEISILDVQIIHLKALIDYLNSRNIPYEIGRKYCRQVWYRYKGKRFFALGLENYKRGWELRNKYFKTSSSPKTFSFFERGSKQLLITEGMFDFLSLASIDEDLVQNSDCIILNSLAFLERIKMLIPKYEKVLIYLDNDPAGKKATGSLLNQFDNITDCSDSYSGYVDLNEKLVNEGSCNKSLTLK
jgi:5S rRNA maturation endonuclease (ribonuclease M5)